MHKAATVGRAKTSIPAIHKLLNPADPANFMLFAGIVCDSGYSELSDSAMPISSDDGCPFAIFVFFVEKNSDQTLVKKSFPKTPSKWLALIGLGLLFGCVAAGDRAQPIAAAPASYPSAVVQTSYPAPSQLAERMGTGSETVEVPVPIFSSDPSAGQGKRMGTGSETVEVPVPILSSDPFAGQGKRMGTGSEPVEVPVPILSDPFAGQGELSADRLIFEVQSRNPSLQAMIAAWRAAAERYPQAVSLDDPMFSYMLGTQGLGPDGGYMLMGTQKIPWFGKQQLRGRIAQSEANAACQDVADLRLRLAEASANALLDYYLVRREKEINAANSELMKEFRTIARVRYEANQVSQQDILQADLELADLQARRAELDREETIAIARINTMIHRPADCPLPPPSNLSRPAPLLPVDELRETALHRRPDLAAVAARIRAEEAAVNLACKEFYPDLEIVGKYDAFMPEPMRPQLGMNVNVPLWQQKRSAAWREAMAKLQQRRAEYADLADRARFEVQSAYAELIEGQEIVRLYEDKNLPVANQYAQSARANYTAGKSDFLRLIDAQRQLYAQWEKYYQSLAAYHRRLAEMQRVVGGFSF